LDGSAINLAVGGHADSFLLVKNAPLVMMVSRASGSSLGGGLGGRGCEAAEIGFLGKVLVLSSRNGRSSEIMSILPGIPRVGGGACGCIGLWGVRFIHKMFKIRFSEFILGR
jgi:hypothetical protein